MGSHEDDRMDALSRAIARVLEQQDLLNRRLTRVEAALSLPPIDERPWAVPPPLPPQPPEIQPPWSPPQSPAYSYAPPPLPSIQAEPPQAPSESARMETNIGLTLINRVGVVTLVLGIGFFFKWAIDNQWIGPATRVGIGVAAGLLTILISDRLWHRGQKVFAQGVTAAGIAILYLSIYAAFGFYDLITQFLAFAAMVVITLMAIALAVRYGSVAMAALGFLGGYLTPVMLSTGTDHPWFLFTYILLLDAGAILLARTRRWPLLGAFGFAATVLLAWGWFEAHFGPGKELVATIFDFAYFALFAPFLMEPVFLLAPVLAAVPLLVIWPADAPVYLGLSLLLGLGGLVAAAMRQSARMVGATFATAWIAFGIWNTNEARPHPLGETFAGVTCMFVLFTAWVLLWTVGRGKAARSTELCIVALNGLIYFGVSYSLLDSDYHQWMGLFALVVAGIHLGLALLIRKDARELDKNAVALAAAFGFAYITLAIAIQFSGYRITMGWALEGAALAWIGARLRQKRMQAGALVVLALACWRLLAFDAEMYQSAERYMVFVNTRFMTFAISALSLWAAARWLEERGYKLTCYIAGHAAMLMALTLELIGWTGRSIEPGDLASVQSVAVSILWALYAIVLVALGIGLRSTLNRLLGLGLIGVVVIKLYIYDVWQLARVFRITSFVVLGILLIVISYVYSRYRAAIESWWKLDN